MSVREALEDSWVPNRGAACTTAALLTALGALGARRLPELGPATLALGCAVPYGAPGLLAYVGLPFRRAPLDPRVESLAAEHGLRVRSSTGLVAPLRPLRPAAGEALVLHLAWGQERPGVYGGWGWHPLRPATYTTGGHSVLLVAVEGREWLVLDPNHAGLQRWPRPGLAVTATRICRI